MKKSVILNCGLIAIGILLFFIPFRSLDFFGKAIFTTAPWQQMEAFQVEYAEPPIFELIIMILFALTIVLLTVNFLLIKQNKIAAFHIYSAILLLIQFVLIIIYIVQPVFKTSPSWSFYLSLFALLGWMIYILSPKWIPFCKTLKSKHHTKAERIAQLEREVEKLKNQDECKEISSDIEKGSD